MQTPHSQHGLGLIDLLIAMAGLTILAAGATPSLLEAQVRSRAARARSDLRTLSTALDAYAVDYRSYPPAARQGESRWRCFESLTTPIPYMQAIPFDPFAGTAGPAPAQGMYRYGANPTVNPGRWALASNGPDRKADIEPLTQYPGYSPELFANGGYALYDPSNGILSRGDLLRANDFLEQN